MTDDAVLAPLMALATSPRGLPALHLREQIFALEEALTHMPGAVYGDSALCPVTHTFADGVYVREIFIPQGVVLTGKIHKYTHPNFLMRGEVLVVTEAGGCEHLVAPVAMISAAGTKRAVVALADTVWVTVHATTETDIAKIEAEVIAPDYAAFDAWRQEARG